MPTKPTYSGPMRFAHRGMVQAGPENTLGAFQGAVDAQLEGIEIDIMATKDGEIVVSHDFNLTRLTLGHPATSNRLVADMTWEELSKVELPYANHLLDHKPPIDVANEFLAVLPGRQMGQEHGRFYEEEFKKEPRMAKFMRFDEYLDWAKAYPHFTEIEVKVGGIIPKVFKILEKSGIAERCIVFSGELSTILEIQEVAAKQGKPENLNLAANIFNLTGEAKRMLNKMDLFEIGLDTNRITEDDVLWLHEREILLFANLGDYPSWWRRLQELGIDGFKTNYPLAYTEWWMENRF